MRAKVRKPRKSRSNLSKREKIRRKPFSLRKSRSISLRLRYMALSYCQGSRRLLLGGNDRDEAEIQRQLAGFVVFVGAVHDQMQRGRQRTDAAQQLASLDGVGGLAGREREGYGRSSIRGNHMNLGCPSAPGLSDRLGSVFFNAPVPSGCTFTM